MLGLAWVRPGKIWRSGNILFLGKIIHGDVFLALSPSWVHMPAPRTPALMGASIPWPPALGTFWGRIQLRATGLRVVAGVTRLFQVGVSSPPGVAPLG